MEGVERIAAKHELTGWVDGDDAYMLLKVGQFECTLKAHKHSTDFLALSEGLLGALKDADAVPGEEAPLDFRTQGLSRRFAETFLVASRLGN